MIQKIKSKIGETSRHLLPTVVIYAIISVLILGFRILIAQLYGQKELGIFTYFFNLVNFIFLVSSFGVADTITKYIAKEDINLKQILKYATKLVLVSTILTILVTLIILNFTALNPEIPWINTAVIVFIVCYTLFMLTFSILRGFQKFTFSVSLSLIYRILLILGLLAAFWLKKDFMYVIFIVGLAYLLPAIVGLFKINDATKNSFELSFKEFTKMSFALLMVNLSLYTLRLFDSIIIKYLFTYEALGVYSAYSSITNVIRLAAYTMPIVIMPLAVKKRYNLSASLKKMLVFLIPFALVVLAGSYILVPLLYGKDYTDNILPIFLVIYSSILVVYSIVNSIFTGENPFSRYYIKIIIIDVLISIIGSIGFSLLLYESLGIISVPIAITITAILKIILNIIAINKLRK